MGKIKVVGIDELIKNYRLQHRLNQKEMSQILGKSQTTVCYWENKTYFPRNSEEINKLSEVLGLPVSDVVKAIEYARTGVIKEYEQKLVELSELNIEDITSAFKVTLYDEELTQDEIKEALEFFKYKHFLKKKKQS